MYLGAVGSLEGTREAVACGLVSQGHLALYVGGGTMLFKMSLGHPWPVSEGEGQSANALTLCVPLCAVGGSQVPVCGLWSAIRRDNDITSVCDEEWDLRGAPRALTDGGAGIPKFS